MPKQDYYKKMFFAGAVWNLVATLTFAVGYKMVFPMFNMEMPRYPVFMLMFLGLAFIFGIGYYWVSRDIHKNHDIVKLGIIGKLMVFVCMLQAGLTGEMNIMLIGPGVVDLIFAILYIEFLNTYKKFSL